MLRSRDVAFARITLLVRTIVPVLVAGAFVACGGSASDSVSPVTQPPAQIAITPNAPAVAVGSQLALHAQVHDASGQIVPGATVFWSSNDTTIVSVSSVGVVTGNNVGTTQIAASSNGQSTVVAVAVLPIAVASVAIAPSTATITIGGSVTLQGIAYDATGNTLTGRTVVWATSAPQVATVDASGKVTAVTAGTATITGTVEGKAASAAINVTVIPVSMVTVSPGSAALNVGQSASFIASALDANGNTLTGRAITWTSASTSVATVTAAGLVKAVGAGTTTITATCEGKTGTAQVVVTAPAPTPVTTVTVTPSTASLTAGDVTTLSATTLDGSGNALSGRAITWASNATQVATVSPSGVVTAVAGGSATITATSEGKKGTANVTVTERVAKLTITPSSLTLAQTNQPSTLASSVLDGKNKPVSGVTVTWASSDSSSVTVTSTGALTATVTAVKHFNGTITITATCNGVKATATVVYND